MPKSTAANQQHIVAGEVPVMDIMRVEVGQSLQGPRHEWCSPEYGRRWEEGFLVFPGS